MGMSCCQGSNTKEKKIIEIIIKEDELKPEVMTQNDNTKNTYVSAASSVCTQFQKDLQTKSKFQSPGPIFKKMMSRHPKVNHTS